VSPERAAAPRDTRGGINASVFPRAVCGKIVEIIKVLVPAGGLLVFPEMLAGDQAHRLAVDFRGDTRGIALGEVHAVNSGKHLDPHRRY